MAEDRRESLKQAAMDELKRQASRRLWAWILGSVGATVLGWGLLILIALIASTALLAGVGHWLSGIFGPHPPAIATDASRPTEWLTPISRQAIALNIPNSVVLAVINQASDGQIYGDRWYCSNGQTTGEACHVAYHKGLLGIGPTGVHHLGIGYSLMGLNGKDMTIPSGDHHSISWNLHEGVTLLAGSLNGAPYWQAALNTFHARFQAPPGWRSTANYANTIEGWLGSYETVSTNSGRPVKQDIVQGLYDSGPNLGAWALADWSHKTGQWDDPGHRPEWVFVVGAAPTGPEWDHPWMPKTVQVIPPPPHSPGSATVSTTRYYLWGHTMLSPVSVVGTLKNGQQVGFDLSTENPKIPVWKDGTVFGAKVPLLGPKALTSITATWPNPHGHNTTTETIQWPEQPSGAVSSVGHVADTKTVAQWWSDIEIASQQTGVPADWIAAEMDNESGGNANAGQPDGAEGLMQIEPATARRLPGYYPGARLNPQENLIMGAELLEENHAQFGSWRLASAAYYAGSGAVSDQGVTLGMSWSQAAPMLNVIPNPKTSQNSGGNTLTIAQYANNIEATSQAIAPTQKGTKSK